MSRELPLRANIEHLRKQAKERLREIQQSDPQAKLTDAQHDIAREYGFVSWPKLRAHVESLQLEAAPAVAPPPSRGGGGVRVAVGANVIRPTIGSSDSRRRPSRRCSSRATKRVSSGVPTIEPEHVLLGLVRAAQKSRLFERAGLSLVGARAEVAPRTVVREPLPSSIEIPFSDSTKQVLRAANEEADRLVHDKRRDRARTLGLLRQPECVAASVLMGRGVDAQGFGKTSRLS